MVTRLYPGSIDFSASHGTNPSAPGASWTVTTGFTNGSLSGRCYGGSFGNAGQMSNVNPNSRCFAILKTVPLQHQTIGGTIKGQFKCSETSSTINGQLAFALTILKTDGTYRAIILDVQSSDDNTAAPPEFGVTLTNRRLRDTSENTSITIPSTEIFAGERLVVEIGCRAYSTDPSNVTITSDASGSVTSPTDLGENDTSTSTSEIGWVEFSQDIKFEEPFFVRGSTIPADGAAASNATATLTVTPPVNMRQGDLCVVFCQSRNSTTWSIGVTGGQSWTSETAFGANAFCRVFWCTFNGTWGASPRFDTTSSTCTSANMQVVRGRTTDEVWVQDVAQTTADHAAAASITRTGVTSTTNAKYKAVFAMIATSDDNTWSVGSSGSGWTEQSQVDPIYARNTAGQDQSMVVGYRTLRAGSAEATNDFVGTEATLGTDAASSFIMVWRCQDFNILNMPPPLPPAKHVRRL